MVTVDAKGLSCPEPLMMAQDAMKKNPDESIEVLVDSPAARDNIMRLAKRKRSATLEDREGFYRIVIE